MRILGIETSCDETAAAVVEDGAKILSDVTASSVKEQEQYGGVVPEVAARRQVEYIIPVIEQALTPDIDVIAVTIGPGLIGSLLIGTETAKTLAYVWQKPLVPVHHIIGHIYSAWLTGKPEFPALVLTVSGGHTELILMRDHGEFEQLGATRDDAAGEAFDKVAQILGLGYPGGPEIEKLATSGDPNTFDLPRPMLTSDDYDFSFSGLKTSVRRYLTSDVRYPDLAASFQQAVVDSLVGKTMRALAKFEVQSVLLTGGVSANQTLRNRLKNEVDNAAESNSAVAGVKFFCPPMKYAMDNATYIAAAAYFNFDRWVLPRDKSLFLTPKPNFKITTP